MPRPETLKRKQAAEIYARTGNASQTARDVGVHRATVMRWLQDPEFLSETTGKTSGLADLVPKAMRVLDDALDGKKITPAQIRAALEVVKASNALKGIESQDSPLAQLIASLDETEGALDSD